MSEDLSVVRLTNILNLENRAYQEIAFSVIARRDIHIEDVVYIPLLTRSNSDIYRRAAWLYSIGVVCWSFGCNFSKCPIINLIGHNN